MAHRHGKGWRGSVQVPGVVAPFRKGGFRTQAAAERWERDTAVDLARGTYRDPDAGAVLFGDWCGRWLATRGTLKASSAREEESVVRNHLRPAFGHVRLDQLGPLAVETLVSNLMKTHAPKTVRNVHGVLHNVMKMALREGLIVANPCEGTRLPEGERQKVMACLTEQEIDRLLAAMPEHWRPLVTVLVGTGLRWGEAVGLKVKYVDLFAAELTVRETLNPTATAWGTPKTKAGRRTIGLPPVVVEVLLPLVAGKGGDEPVFTTPEGDLIRHRWFMVNVWEPAVTKASLEQRPTPHDLRHSHAALLIADGTPLSAIKDRLGHESILTTDRTYGYLLPRVESELLAGLERVLGGSRSTPAIPVASPDNEKTPADPA
ncbi:MAG: tyrosine-type recombinase/integrase [Mycobacteriaceae bacterium]